MNTHDNYRHILASTTSNIRTSIKTSIRSDSYPLGSMGKQIKTLHFKSCIQNREMQFSSNNNSKSIGHPRLAANRQPLHVVIIPTIISILLIIICTQIQSTHQQLLCPKVCHCDEQTLETVCRGSILASGIPLTLNPSTKRIAINHAQITLFSTLDYIKNLESLDLAYNKIAAIDFVHINSNSDLIFLNASHNNLSELKDSTVTAAFSKLESSSINAPFTNARTEETEKLKALRKAKINVLELILSYNHLTILRNFTFLRWAKLQRLDLSFNSLVSIEIDSLFGLTKLKHLNLRANHLIQIPGQAFLGTTRSLNFISAISEQSISQLKSLDMSENALVSLEPDSFTALGQLEELYLESCSLQSIDERAFRELTHLSLLFMNRNDLNEVPTNSLNSLSTLRQLSMDSNPIQQLRPYAFSNLFNLEDLQLNNGSVRELQAQALSGLISLRRLSLAHNSNLTTIYPNLMDDLPKLVHLNLYKCSLAFLPGESSLDGRPLTVLDLRGNHLICDCRLKWLTKWLEKLNETVIMNLNEGKSTSRVDSVIFQNYVKSQLTDAKLSNELINITCAGPQALSGKAIINLPNNNLECIRPNSKLNVHVGFASLFLMTLLLITACMINLCRDERHFMGIIKENLAHNRISMMLPYSQDLHKNVNNFSKEAHLECAEYEPVDYGHSYGQIYTIPGDQYTSHNSTSQQQTHQM